VRRALLVRWRPTTTDRTTPQPGQHSGWSGRGSPDQDPGADGTGVVAMPECGCDHNLGLQLSSWRGSLVKSRRGTQFWPQPPKVSHGGGCAERAPVTCASSNPVRASATLPEYVTDRTPSGLGVVYVGTVLRSASGLSERMGGRWHGAVVTGALRSGPGARTGRVASCSGCPPWRCCALSGRGPPQRWRRHGAAAARGRQRARHAVGGPP
jgi:hypothetical protein